MIIRNKSTASNRSLSKKSRWAANTGFTCTQPRPRFCCGSWTYKLFSPREGLLASSSMYGNSKHISHINQVSNTEMKHDWWVLKTNAGATEIQQLKPGGPRPKTDHWFRDNSAHSKLGIWQTRPITNSAHSNSAHNQLGPYILGP